MDAGVGVQAGQEGQQLCFGRGITGQQRAFRNGSRVARRPAPSSPRARDAGVFPHAHERQTRLLDSPRAFNPPPVPQPVSLLDAVRDGPPVNEVRPAAITSDDLYLLDGDDGRVGPALIQRFLAGHQDRLVPVTGQVQVRGSRIEIVYYFPAVQALQLGNAGAACMLTVPRTIPSRSTIRVPGPAALPQRRFRRRRGRHLRKRPRPRPELPETRGMA